MTGPAPARKLTRPSRAGWSVTIASDWAPLRRYGDLMRSEPLAVYGDLLPLFAQSALNVVNVEAVLSDRLSSPIVKDGPHLSGESATADVLPEVGFQLACLANNHIMDHGEEGLVDTVATLHARGITTVGAGVDPESITAPALFEVDGCRIAVVNCADGESGRSLAGETGVYGLDVAAVSAQIRQLSDEGHQVVVIFHGGREYLGFPPPFVVRDLRQLATSGAAAVIAHHPHAPQPFEIHHGVPIFYSLGNFVFWQDSDSLFRHLGYLVRFRVDEGRLAEFELVPYAIEESGLELLEGATRQWFLDQLAVSGAWLADPEVVADLWNGFVDRPQTQGIVQDFVRLSEVAFGSAASPEEQSARRTAAGVLQNRFLTPAHSELCRGYLHRVMSGTLGSSSEAAQRFVEQWLTTPRESLAALVEAGEIFGLDISAKNGQ